MKKNYCFVLVLFLLLVYLNSFSFVFYHVHRSFGNLAVPANHKWENIFNQCRNSLGSGNTEEAWERVAAILSANNDKMQQNKTR